LLLILLECAKKALKCETLGEAPWIEDLQVEQDLFISRALVEIFSAV
jgi:hypothetical protein